MSERPILFNGPMVRAILEGRKTQTRRPLPAALQRDLTFLDCEDEHDVVVAHWEDGFAGRGWYAYCGSYPDEGSISLGKGPVGEIGDLLWVRETWQPTPFHLCGAEGCDCDDVRITYNADGASRICTMTEGWTPPGGWQRYEGTQAHAPSIHMPRWASRLTLRVVGCRVERLQDISEEDALAEGVGGAPEDVFNNARDKFAAIWRDCYGAESWTSNPWVVVRAFVPVTS